VSDAGYVFGGYAATAVVLGTYALWVVRRRRALSRLLPPDERR
jgi:heme exporter protein CcmD